MEWKAILFQSLLILSEASQVINACSCAMISWEEAICPKRDKTGSCVMEWNVLFFQSLLILLGASQVTNACTCTMARWEYALCPKLDKTVVNATTISVERLNHQGNVSNDAKSAPNARYQMRLESTFATGSTDLTVNNGIFAMMFPWDGYVCGTPLALNKGYVFSGNVHQDGILFSSVCEIAFAMDDVNDNITSILNGNIEVNCVNL